MVAGVIACPGSVTYFLDASTIDLTTLKIDLAPPEFNGQPEAHLGSDAEELKSFTHVPSI